MKQQKNKNSELHMCCACSACMRCQIAGVSLRYIFLQQHYMCALYRFGINLDSPTAKTACTTRCTKKSDRVRSYDNSLDIIKNNKI